MIESQLCATYTPHLWFFHNFYTDVNIIVL